MGYVPFTTRNDATLLGPSVIYVRYDTPSIHIPPHTLEAYGAVGTAVVCWRTPRLRLLVVARAEEVNDTVVSLSGRTVHQWAVTESQSVYESALANLQMVMPPHGEVRATVRAEV